MKDVPKSVLCVVYAIRHKQYSTVTINSVYYSIGARQLGLLLLLVLHGIFYLEVR